MAFSVYVQEFGRYVSSGRYASFLTFLQGLVFKWGSLVGIRQPSVGANGSSHFAVSDTAFVPNEFTGRITNDWTSVPYCTTDFAPYNNTAVDHLSRVNDPTAGLGDICRYMGVVDSANWRMPTQSELDELYRNGLQNGGEARRIDNNSDWSPGLFAPLHGYAFGPHQSIVTIVSDAEVANANPYINGAVFLPASGRREVGSGAIAWIGLYGFYWSSTAFDVDNGYLMNLDSAGVYSQSPHVRTYAMSIRCIRE